MKLLIKLLIAGGAVSAPAFTVTMTALSNALGTVTTNAYINGGGGGSITPSVTVSRSSGKELLAVYFDASATTASTTSNPEHELFYAWDFGDDRSTYWAYGTNTSQNKNAAYGPQAAHVYTTAGTFTPTCVILDGSGNTTTWTGSTITVSAWAEADTIYVANGATPSAGSNGVGSGATYANETTWAGVLARMASGKRVRLRKGDTWTASASAGISALTTAQIDSYGLSGANPIVNATYTSSGSRTISMSSSCSDVRISGLTFTRTVANTDDVSCIYGQYTGNLLVHNCDISGDHEGVTVGVTPLTPTTGVFVVDCNIHDIGVDNNAPTSGNEYYGFYWESTEKIAVLGSRLYNVVTGHVARFAGIKNGIIANCDMANGRAGYGGGSSGVLTVRGFTNNADNSIFSGIYTERVIVRDNKLYSTVGNNYVMHMGTQGDYDAVRHRNNIIENNYIESTTAGPVWNRSATCTIRNNIITCTDNPYGILCNSRSDYGAPEVTGTRIYNNTIWKRAKSSGANGFTGIYFGANAAPSAAVTDVEIHNNICYAPLDTVSGTQNFPYPMMFEQGGAGSFSYLAYNNSNDSQVKNNKPWAATTPAAYVDYTPSGPYAVNGGISVPVVKDFFNATITGTREIGAIQA